MALAATMSETLLLMELGLKSVCWMAPLLEGWLVSETRE